MIHVRNHSHHAVNVRTKHLSRTKLINYYKELEEMHVRMLLERFNLEVTIITTVHRSFIRFNRAQFIS